MAITDFTILGKTIGRVANNAPSLGCGAVILATNETLPPGDYVAVALTGSGTYELTDVEYNGVGMVDKDSALATSIRLDARVGTTQFYINIKTCKVIGPGAIFYRRCNN